MAVGWCGLVGRGCVFRLVSGRWLLVVGLVATWGRGGWRAVCFLASAGFGSFHGFGWGPWEVVSLDLFRSVLCGLWNVISECAHWFCFIGLVLPGSICGQVYLG